jgi:hypothetical protein
MRGVGEVPDFAVDHSHQSNYGITNEWSYTSALPTCFLGVQRTFAYYTTLKVKLCLIKVV